MDFLNKLRSLSEPQRKIILWSAIIILALFLFIWWIRNVGKKLESFRAEDLKQQFQLLKTPKIEMLEIEIPEISEEELKKLLEEKLSEDGQ